jgi:regulator of nucleoside diphosphate kinase
MWQSIDAGILEVENVTQSMIVTQTDFNRLMALIDSSRIYRRHDQHHVDELEDELARAQVVPDGKAPSGTVTMYSVVHVTDLNSGVSHTYQVVLPHDADPSKNRISVLAPIGTALLGEAAGTTIEWKMPGGNRSLRIDRVSHRKRPSVQAA